MSSSPKHYVVGVVLYPDALPLDFIGPTCLLNALNPSRLRATSSPLLTFTNPSEATQATFECIHLAETLDPVKCSFGTSIVPDRTFAAVKQAHEGKDSNGQGDGGIDVLLLPGGTGARPWNASEVLKAFVSWAAGELEHVLTVCTGSWLLASTGALNGQKATTNKKAFLECTKHTQGQQDPSINVEWLSHARWVHSGKFWTASGVSAGMDMACAFIDEVAGKAAGEDARAYAEYTSNGEGDDPWAAASSLA